MCADLTLEPLAMDNAAERLNRATEAGNLAAAYGVLKPLAEMAAQGVMLKAGYTVVSGEHGEFWNDAQVQLSQACRARKTGRGLREARGR